MKRFNTTAICIPARHYMVDLSERVKTIKQLVDDGKYFTINRPRQYGKTTTLSALKRVLSEEYIVLFLNFERIDNDVFENGSTFSQAMARMIIDAHEFNDVPVPEDTISALEELNNSDPTKIKMDNLFRVLKRWIKRSEKPIVLIIDEVDSATNSQVFLDFLAQLRDGYISRDLDGSPAFQSVILAGVTDVKYLKSRIRSEEDSKENSPWNIAADFTIDMSLSETGIKGMLNEYEADHHTGMNTEVIAKSIRKYTNGYPFLVSRICQLIDEKMVPSVFKTLEDAWTDNGVEEAVKSIISEKNTLFDSIMGKLHNFDKLRGQLYKILLQGDTVEYLPDDKQQEQLIMYGFIMVENNTIAVANRIFEMRLYKYFVGNSRFTDELREEAIEHKTEFIRKEEIDVPLIMEHFIQSQRHIRDLDNEEAERKFIEEEGRIKFLTYLSPILNGVGTYGIEEATRNRRRMDVVIHYRGKRYIIELKIWHGDRYNEKGEQQICDYLDYFGLDTGYLLSFSFNKNKEIGVKKVKIRNKTLYEGVL
ncbi:MAG: AAA family ATPase [Clostridia bacterium]|nr:AAA family ATPase [Clostridia bacterium]